MKAVVFLFLVIAAASAAGCQSLTSVETIPPVVDAPPAKIEEISVADAKPLVAEKDAQFIDVRTVEEYRSGHAPNALNFPLEALPGELGRLDKNKPVYLICQTGRRSMDGAKILKEAGFTSVFSIAGGTSAWTAAGFPTETVPAPNVRTKLDEKTRQALLEALADERRAQAVYRAVLNKFGEVRPFVNIVEAERRHEAMLLPLFEKYALEIPQNEFDAAKTQEVPATLAEACRAAIKGEEENIALYDKFFGFVKEPDIRQVFRYLQSASKDNHLPAFTRCAAGTGTGRGRGRPF